MDATHMLLNTLMTLATKHDQNLTEEQVAAFYRNARAIGGLCQRVVDDVLYGTPPVDRAGDPEVLIRAPGAHGRWEHEIRRGKRRETFESELKSRGKDGWELAAFSKNGDEWEAVYKRKY